VAGASVVVERTTAVWGTVGLPNSPRQPARDSVNTDDMGDVSRPAHCRLLGAGIPIVEHLVGLDQLIDITDFTFTAAPPKFAALGTFPVRAFARVLQS
jgi:kynurenine formamidase